eukprot:1176559-Rhodomonas_salina.1
MFDAVATHEPPVHARENLEPETHTQTRRRPVRPAVDSALGQTRPSSDLMCPSFGQLEPDKAPSAVCGRRFKGLQGVKGL